MSDRKLIPLSTVSSEIVEWLWTDRIPLRGITILDGDPGDGKSSIMYDLSARVTTGKPMPLTENVIGPAGAVLLQAEDSLGATVRPSFEATGGDVSRVCVYDRRHFSEQPLRLHEDCQIIEDAIATVDAKLVVIDPLPAFLGGNPNSAATTGKAMSELAFIAEKKNVAIVIVRHLTKGRATNTKYRGSGSIGIIGAARSALLVGHDPSSDNPHQHILALNKSNLSDAPSLSYRTVKRDAAITVEWLEESPHDVEDLSASTADRFARSQLEEACYVLYTILSEYGHPMPAKVAEAQAKDALVSPRTLKRAKKELGVTSRKTTVRSAKDGDPVAQWVWELPKDKSLLRRYRDRAMMENAQDTNADIDEVAQPIPETMPEPEDSTPIANHHLWSELEESDSVPEPLSDVPGGRPWDD